MIDYVQLMDHLSIGVVVINHSLDILFWNRWMTEHSMLSSEEAMGKPICELFPTLLDKGFIRKANNVFKLGHPAFFTHKVHQYMFPFHTTRSYIDTNLNKMQQTVILSPLKDEEGVTKQILISVFDITDWVVYQEQLVRSKSELERLSQIDDLTQIANRRSVMEKLETEITIHCRKKRPLAIALIDIDFFKNVNDNHGHQCGDYVLTEMAKVLGSNLRGYDVLGRYGGEEFILILPEATEEQVFMICERIRQRVEKNIFNYESEDLKLTVSIGIALKTAEEQTTSETLFRVADDCLYKAKESGRNKLVIHK
jgi:diguanylate cyclase (GGDEF)-like protein